MKKCKRGHDLTKENTKICKNGSVECAECRKLVRRKGDGYCGQRPTKEEKRILDSIVGV